MSRAFGARRRRPSATAPLTKSEQMARVRTAHTAPELALRRELWSLGLRYRLHRKLPGKPDLVFGPSRVVVFIDGCFWHSCPDHATYPRTNRAFWSKKLATNIARDRRVDSELRELGWKVVRIWEHSVQQSLEQTARRLARIVRPAFSTTVS